MVLYFLQTSTIPPTINHTQIALLPKVENPKLLSQFRLISLCNVSYKIISKILVHPLRPFLNKLISPYQNAFVLGRAISDNVLLAHELLHSMNRKRTSRQYYFGLKLDIEKDYDRLEWTFLRFALTKFNLHPTSLIEWIMTYVTSCTFQVKVNNHLSDTWKPSCGIRQGDPLSPYLFILCQELFVHLLLRQTSAHRLQGLRLCSSGPSLPILCFADDCMVFCKASSQSVTELQHCLQLYAAASGQTVCWQKSRILFSPNTPPDVKRHTISTLGVSPNKCKDKYLCVPFLVSRKKSDLFDHIIDCATARINTWYSRFLSYVGQATLIQSVTNTIPMYCMSIAKLPSTCIAKLNGINQHFLWNATKEGFRRGRLSWRKVCRPKALCGLGIRNLSTLNTAFQLKLVWRMLHDPTSLWACAYKAKYFPRTSFLEAPT